MKKIGFTCGVYDLFHVGHLNLFERCKKHCDYLIVGVCDDKYVRDYKGKEPIIGEKDRARIIGALKCVDEVHIIGSLPTVDKMVAHNMFNYNVLFAGSDWQGSERFQKTVDDFKANNLDIEIVFLPYTQSVSTTQLREKLKNE